MQISSLAAVILSIGAVSSTAIIANNSPTVAQNSAAALLVASDTLMTMPLLEGKGWFIHAHNVGN